MCCFLRNVVCYFYFHCLQTVFISIACRPFLFPFVADCFYFHLCNNVNQPFVRLFYHCTSTYFIVMVCADEFF